MYELDCEAIMVIKNQNPLWSGLGLKGRVGFLSGRIICRKNLTKMQVRMKKKQLKRPCQKISPMGLEFCKHFVAYQEPKSNCLNLF